MEVKLDIKDKRILYELDLNSRQSFGKIAKKVGLSKNAVIYRVNNLKKLGVIKNFHAWIDMTKLGFIEFRIYLNLKNASPKKEEEIIEFLSNKKIVTWVGSMEGEYNLGAKIVTRNIYEMHEFWDELFQKFVNFIEKRLMTIIAGSNYYYKTYLLNSKENHEKESVRTSIELEKIDEIDENIIKHLTKDARISIIELSEKIRVTPKTIISHIRDLEKRRVIVGYGTVLDLEKMGYKNFKVSFILFRLTPEKMNDFRNYAMRHPNIIYDEEVIGGDDYELEVQVRDLRDLREIIRDIKSCFAEIVQDYKVLFMFEDHKHVGFPEKGF